MTTPIEWTDETWNPTDGCEVCSPGCANCYAMRFAGRFAKKGERYHGLVSIAKNKRAIWTGESRLDAGKLAKPLHWKKPRRIFVNSMSDLFYEGFTNEQIAAVFGVMAACPQHTFQVLTKRAKRMREWFEWAGRLNLDELQYTAIQALRGTGAPLCSRGTTWPLPNVWIGVSVEDQERADERIPELLRTPAAVRFLSCEPLLGELDLSRWLGGHGVEDQASRGAGVRSGDLGRTGDRHDGTGVEGRGSTLGSVDTDDAHDPVQASSGGEPQRDWLPAGPGDGRRGAMARFGAPAGVASLLRSDPDRDDGEPQERDQARQPAGEPRARHGLGAADPREPGTGYRPGREPARRTESIREGDVGTGRGDQGGAIQRRDVLGDRASLRDHVPAGLAHRSRSEPLGWIIVGCESGPGARPCDVAWLRSLRDQCAAAGTAFFLKQARENGEESRWSDGVMRLAVAHGAESHQKSGGVIGLPYLDGVQHAAFPEPRTAA